MLRCDTSILLQRRCLPRTEGQHVQHAALLQRLGNLLGARIPDAVLAAESLTPPRTSIISPSMLSQDRPSYR